MQLRELLDFAVTLSEQFSTILAKPERLDDTQLQQYWLTSRARFNTWGSKLRLATVQLEHAEFGAPERWVDWIPLFEEILIDDVVTRVWATLLEAIDDELGLREYAPIGRSAVVGHEDARSRVVNVILRGCDVNCSHAHRLNRSRVNAERWTDLLLAHACRDLLHLQYCRDPARFSAFVAAYQEGNPSSLAVVRAAADTAIPARALVPTHVDFHRRMHGQMVGALGADLILPVASWLSQAFPARLISLADHTQAMIDRWQQIDLPDET